MTDSVEDFENDDDDDFEDSGLVTHKTDDTKELDDNSTGYSSDGDDDDRNFSSPEFDMSSIDYETKTKEDIWAEIVASCQDLMEITGFNQCVCRALMYEYKGDKQKLLEQYSEFENAEAFVFDKLQLDISDSIQFHQLQGACDICCDDGVLTGLRCTHLACLKCYDQYITMQIKEGNTKINCFQSGCNYILRDQQVKELVQPEIWDRYERLLCQLFIDINKSSLWCPGNNCGKIIQLSDPLPYDVVCSCGESFCSACKLPPHFPLDCQQVKVWCTDKRDLENLSWIKVHAKHCPKCNIPSEKISGCNFMRCVNPTCRAFFCWGCLQVLNTDHAPHQCHVAGSDPSSSGNDNVTHFKQYNTGYTKNNDSRELEEKLLPVANELVRRMQIVFCTLSDVSVVKKAVPTLLKCRSLLSNCYAFTYYLRHREGVKDLLLFNIQNLETETEKFSQYITQKLTTITRDEFDSFATELNTRLTSLLQYRTPVERFCSQID